MTEDQPLNIVYYITIVIFSILIAAPASADELRLKNGDRLTGTVVSMEADRLVFTTSYAGKLTIAWEEIVHVSTDKPLEVRLADGTTLKGKAGSSEDGTMVIKPEKIAGTIAFATADIEAINPEVVPAVRWNGRVNIGGVQNRGNTEDWEVHADAEMVARTEKSRYTVVGELDREEATKKKRDGGDGKSSRTEDYTFVSFKYDYFFAEQWYLYNTASAESDDMADMNLRTTLGAGVGHQFFDTDSTKFSLEAGPTYVNTNYDDDDDEDEDYGAGRWAVRFEQRLFDNLVTFFHSHEGVVRSDDTNYTFFRSRSGFRIPAYRKISFTLQYNFDWEKTPAENSTGTDTKAIYKVGYEW